MITDPTNTGRDPVPQAKVARAFNGVWIPASLWRRKDLTWFQKCLLAEISSFEECFASNGYLAELMNSTAKNVSNEISALRKKGLILDWGWDGERRYLTVARDVHPNPHGDPIQLQVDTLSSCGWNRVTSVGARGLKETKETPEVSGAPLVSDFGRKKLTKEEACRFLRWPRFPIPSKTAVESVAEERGWDKLLECGRLDDAYKALYKNKWHHHNGKRWSVVRHWEDFFEALENTMRDACG